MFLLIFLLTSALERSIWLRSGLLFSLMFKNGEFGKKLSVSRVYSFMFAGGCGANSPAGRLVMHHVLEN